jgi:hypothetical protein
VIRFFPPFCWYFNFFPLGGNTEFVGGFFKSIISDIYWYHTIFLEKKQKKTGKNEVKNVDNQTIFPMYVIMYVCTLFSGTLYESDRTRGTIRKI